MPENHPPTTGRLRGDEDQLFRDLDGRLRRHTQWRLATIPYDIVDEACNEAWARLLRCQPRRDTVWPWLRTVAYHEALRLHRRTSREHVPSEDAVETAGDRDPELVAQAHEALTALSQLPTKQRRYLELLISGHSYNEIAATEHATYTNVNKHLTKARRTLTR